MGAALETNELRELYRELILDHAKAPRHFGALEGATHRASGVNPLCGDRLELYVEIGDDGRIAAVSFEGTGCAISVASASLLTETVVGMHEDEALGFVAALTGRLTGGDGGPDVELGKLEALQGVKDFPSRVKCATLAWHALKAALDKAQAPATTE